MGGSALRETVQWHWAIQSMWSTWRKDAAPGYSESISSQTFPSVWCVVRELRQKGRRKDFNVPLTASDFRAAQVQVAGGKFRRYLFPRPRSDVSSFHANLEASEAPC